MTGLYPESQGIVGNKVYDPNYNEKVNFLEYNGEAKLDPKWWNNCNIRNLKNQFNFRLIILVLFKKQSQFG